jgi:hypothetical protein
MVVMSSAVDVDDAVAVVDGERVQDRFIRM